jgi:chemotaxis protein MotA
MNFYSILGFVLAILVVGIGFRLSTDNPIMFLDYPSLFFVIGGTLAATSITFPLNEIVTLFKIFVRRIFFHKKYNYTELIKDIVDISESNRKGENFEDHLDKYRDHFLNEGLKIFSDSPLGHEHSLIMLQKRCTNLFSHHMEEAKKIQTLGKFPPAFGMMGTTVGMVVLLSNLASKDAIKMVGPAMAICLITTLYGLIFANLIVIPAAENLISQTKEVYLKNRMIVEGFNLITQKTNPIVLVEELNNFLSPGDRVDWKEVI